MSANKITCLYCETENSETGSCKNCGMPLALNHPNNKQNKTKLFVKWFVFIVIFSITMIIYLPR